MAGVSKQFGNYTLLKEISRGGMGVVYCARHNALRNLVALKVMLQVTETREKARFQREARALVTVNHPNVIRASDMGEEAGRPFFVMELIQGSDLKKIVEQSIAKEGVVPSFDWTLQVFREIAAGLAACQKAGLVHRDLKPENILIESSTGRAVIVDFGLVTRNIEKSKLESYPDTLTRSGEVMGTVAYMAPEQADSDTFGPVGPHTDIWGLGATLFYCLTGRAPFTGATAINVYTQLIMKDVPLVSSINSSVPKLLCEVVESSLIKDSSERLDLPEVQLRMDQPLEPVRESNRPSRIDFKVGLLVLVIMSLIIAIAQIASNYGGLNSERRLENRALTETSNPKVGEWDKLHLREDLEILKDRLVWNKASHEQQDRVIKQVARNLGDEYEFKETKIFTCAEQRHRIATFQHFETGLLLNLIPGGSYEMGSSETNGIPVHRVVIQPFLIGRSEVRKSIWAKFSNVISPKFEGSNSPIESVSWNDCQAWLKKVGGGLRLPSESEWEYACRAGSVSNYFWGDSMDDSFCWYKENRNNYGRGKPLEVTQHFKMGKWNSFGLLDMSGNLWEWCEDRYASYEFTPRNSQAVTGNASSQYSAQTRIIRGGSWSHNSSYSRSAVRGKYYPDRRHNFIGIRVARSLNQLK